MSPGTPQRLEIPPMRPEGIIAHGRAAGPPGTIAIVRLHAFGDSVITLPLVAALRAAYPQARITMVTAAEHAGLFEAVEAIDAVVPVVTIGGRLRRALSALRAGVRVRSADVLLDLQRSRQADLMLRAAAPAAWARFDRFAPATALDRYVDAAHAAGLGPLRPIYRVAIRPEAAAKAARLVEGAGDRPLVCVNPAGCWPTKNWPVDRYIELARRMIAEWNARIVLMGTGNVRDAARRIVDALGDDALDLVDRTSAAEALALVGRARLVVSDDSGLMHLAWVSGVPTIALFGASRATWSRACGDHAVTLGSEDLPCGACMQPVCARGDLLCLERRTVDEVFAIAGGLVRSG